MKVMLRDSRVAMIWRRVSDLKRVKASSKKLLALRKVGEDAYSVLYDAGGTLLGFWVQDEAALRADDSCSALNFSKYVLISNPASEVMLVSPKFQDSVARLNNAFKVSAAPLKTERGDTLRFFDDDGNLSSFHRPSKATLAADKAGLKLRTLVNNRAESTGVIGQKFLVTNLTTSQQFYKNVLGLRALRTAKGEAIFDAGAITLTLENEPSIGLVRSLNKTGRLLGDWTVFHVNDIEAEMRDLKKRGVAFPRGVEESGIGRMAYFQDPDGHSLVIWQPSGTTTKLQPINFYSPLNRILSEAV